MDLGLPALQNPLKSIRASEVMRSKLAWSDSRRTSSRMELKGLLLSLPRVKGTMQ